MGKIRQWIKRWIQFRVERSFQKKANRLFMKHQVRTTDGDNT